MGEDVGQLLTLPLGADVCAKATLQEFKRTFVLRHLQQLHAALLVRCMTDNLTDQVADEFGMLGLNLKKTKRNVALVKINQQNH